MDDQSKCYNKAIALLAVRGYSVAELTARLTHAGFDETAVTKTIEDCCAQGYLNDEHLLEEVIRVYMSKGKGPLYIRQKIYEKKLDADQFENLMPLDSEEWLTVIEKIWSRKFTSSDLEFSKKQKVYRFFASRGFMKSQVDAYINSLQASTL